MSSNYSSLKIELMGTGEQPGQWGNVTNVNLGTAIEQAIVGMATLDTAKFTANVCALTLANTNAAQDARAVGSGRICCICDGCGHCARSNFGAR